MTQAVNRNKLLRVFKFDATDFSTNGLGVIFDADQVKVHMELTGTRTLEFQLPYNSRSWKLLKLSYLVVCEGQIYRIMSNNRKSTGDSVPKVTCYHIFSDSSKVYIGDFAKREDSAYNIMVSAYANSPFHVLSPNEVAALGMVSVTDRVYLEENGDCFATDIVAQCMQSLKKGELYIDNWNIALVERVGHNKNVLISDTVNSEAIDESSDMSDLINYVTVIGKDGLPLDVTKYPNRIMQSPTSIALYGVRQGSLSFPDEEDKANLETRALYAFSNANPNRIDMPKQSVTVTYVDLAKMYAEYPTLGLGDSVIIPSYLTLEDFTNVRITVIDYYPLSPENSSITVGDPPRTLGSILGDSAITNDQIGRISAPNGKVKANWLTSIQKTMSTYFNATLGKLQVEQHKTGDIWLHPDNDSLAVGIIGGMLAIANKKDAAGNLMWTSFGDGNGFTADVINAGLLSTSKVAVQDDEGFMEILASLIKMYSYRDPGTDRTKDKVGFVVGKDADGNFKLQINDKDGSPKIYMDDAGQIIIDGKLGANAVITDGLYAKSGNVSNITVNSLESADPIPLYLKRDTSDMYFTRIRRNFHYFISASTNGSTTQLTNPDGKLVYWQESIATATLDTDGYPLLNGSRVLTTTDNTGFPVTVYAYTEHIKGSIGFEPDSKGNVVLMLGAGSDPNNPTYSRFKVYKDQDEADVIYTTSTGVPRGLLLTDGEGKMVGMEKAYADIRSANTIPLAAQTGISLPTTPVNGQLFFLET